MRMYWKVLGGRIRGAVRDCDSVQSPTQLQVTKENIMGKHEHAFSLPVEPGQNMHRDVRGPSVFRSFAMNMTVRLIPVCRQTGS